MHDTDAAGKVLHYGEHLDSKNEIKIRIKKQNLPDFINMFLTDNWSRALQSVYISDGNTSKAWETSINTMDDLIWSIYPKRTSAERETLINLIPELHMQLNKGMDLINLNNPSRSLFFDQLSEHPGGCN